MIDAWLKNRFRRSKLRKAVRKEVEQEGVTSGRLLAYSARTEVQKQTYLVEINRKLRERLGRGMERNDEIALCGCITKAWDAHRDKQTDRTRVESLHRFQFESLRRFLEAEGVPENVREAVYQCGVTNMNLFVNAAPTHGDLDIFIAAIENEMKEKMLDMTRPDVAAICWSHEAAEHWYRAQEKQEYQYTTLKDLFVSENVSLLVTAAVERTESKV